MADRFDVKRRIVTPAGIRYGAVDLQTGKAARLQRIPPDESEYVLNRAALEAVSPILTAIDHPNLVPVLELGTDPDGGYAACAFVEGVPLLERLQHTGPFNFKDAMSVARDCLLGLAALQSVGLRHGDISPHRIIVLRDAEGRLGARLAEPTLVLLMTLEEPFEAGKPIPGLDMGFVAPEVILGQPSDHRADLYSLGCVLYFAFSGIPPFTGADEEQTTLAQIHGQRIPLATRKRDVPPKIAHWVMTLMHTDVDHRPVGAQHALELLDAAMGKAEPPAPKPVIGSGITPAPAFARPASSQIAAPAHVTNGKSHSGHSGSALPVVSMATVASSPSVSPAIAPKQSAKWPWIVGLIAIALGTGAWFVLHPPASAASTRKSSVHDSAPAPESGIYARYVRIEMPAKVPLTLAEVEVFSKGKNVALKQFAKQSSTAHGGLASRAVDGNTNGVYSAGTSTHTVGEEAKQWWELDLRKEELIEKVVVWNRTEAEYSKRLNGYYVVLFDITHNEVYRSDRRTTPTKNDSIVIKRK